jgi:multidrug efflux system membrane fusion protein
MLPAITTGPSPSLASYPTPRRQPDGCRDLDRRSVRPATPPPVRAGAVALVLASALLAACSRPVPAPEPVRAVRTLVVAEGTAGTTQLFAAEVRARTESRLGFRVGGKLLSRSAELGQRVRAGQVLARLDPADLQLGQDSARAALRAAHAQHELAEADARRFRELKSQGFISGAELDRRETALRAAAAQLDQARAQVDIQGNQATYAALQAPASGVVTAVEAEPGAVLAVGAPVLRLAHDGPRDAVFAVPETQAAAYRALLGRAGALHARAWGSDALLPATVREVAAAADPATRTFLVKADLGSAPVQLGQTLTVLAAEPRLQGVVRLPLASVFQHLGQSAVWLVDRETMMLKAQPVRLAGADGNEVVVAAGLAPGERVVTAGVHALQPGQKVKLWADPVVAGAPARAAATPTAAASAAPR